MRPYDGGMTVSGHTRTRVVTKWVRRPSSYGEKMGGT